MDIQTKIYRHLCFNNITHLYQFHVFIDLGVLLMYVMYFTDSLQTNVEVWLIYKEGISHLETTYTVRMD